MKRQFTVDSLQLTDFRLFIVAHKCQMLIDKLLLNDKWKMVNI